jgi:hypothetical protein
MGPPLASDATLRPGSVLVRAVKPSLVPASMHGTLPLLVASSVRPCARPCGLHATQG